MASDMQKIESCFSAEVLGARTARALDALLALEECASAEMLRRGAVATESVPFARPTGVSMCEADALSRGVGQVTDSRDWQDHMMV
jgi:hypothetical protein